MATIGYARVSTADQALDLQLDALRKDGCDRIFTDVASGALEDRPELASCMDYLRPGDTLLIWRLDRLGRSIKHLIEVVGELEAGGIGLRSLCEGIDTSTAGGRLVFHVFGALAEFERELIRERTRAGLEAARARGRRGGRPRVMTAEKLEVARSMHSSKQHTVAAIAATIGVSESSVRRALASPVPA